MYFTDQLKGADKYAVFLNGNNPVTTIKNPDCKNNKKLLIIKDSFSHCLAPFLSENFSEVTLVDMRYYKNLSVKKYVQRLNLTKFWFVWNLTTS